MAEIESVKDTANGSTSPVLKVSENSLSHDRNSELDKENTSEQQEFNPANVLFSVVEEIILQLLKKPMTEDDIAAALNVSKVQTRIWLQRFIDDGRLKKLKKPVRYTIKQPDLFQSSIKNNACENDK